MAGFLLKDEPIASLDDYLAVGGGEGLSRALEIGPEDTIAEVRRAGLRGRGGAGFPTGIKWRGLRADPASTKYVVCNGAEGEPGTFKDRWLLRTNPYQVLEGLQIAAFAVGAAEAFIAIKRRFRPEGIALKRALTEMSEAGLTGDLPVGIVEGPDDYLFGEEKALLEVVEGNDPLPRLYPPYVQGLFEEADESKPAVVNNVETLSNAPHILRNGADWFRSMGTEESPGTMVFTVSGDVRREAVAELELGTPLSFLVYGIGEGLRAGRRVKAALSGVSNRPVPGRLLDTPLSFEGMSAIRSGLGSGGFIVYDDTTCMAQVGHILSGFLHRESCGQCPPCKLGTGALRDLFGEVQSGRSDGGEVDEIAAWILRVTDANRCGLGSGQQVLADGIYGEFGEDLIHHLDGAGCPSPRELKVPSFVDWDREAGEFAR